MKLREARKAAKSLRDDSDRKGIYLAMVAEAIIILDDRITELETQRDKLKAKVKLLTQTKGDKEKLEEKMHADLMNELEI